VEEQSHQQRTTSVVVTGRREAMIMICFHGLILTDVIDIDDKTPDSMLQADFEQLPKNAARKQRQKL